MFRVSELRSTPVREQTHRPTPRLVNRDLMLQLRDRHQNRTYARIVAEALVRLFTRKAKSGFGIAPQNKWRSQEYREPFYSQIV